MPPKDLPSYVTWVIDQKPELRDTPQEIKKEIQIEMEERLNELINAAMLAAMPPSELDEFERLLTHGTEADIQSFCQTVIPDMEELVARILVQFRNDYLGA